MIRIKQFVLVALLVASGSDFTVFKIAPSRGSGVLLDVLGEEFNGVIGCDYFSAYHSTEV